MLYKLHVPYCMRSGRVGKVSILRHISTLEMIDNEGNDAHYHCPLRHVMYHLFLKASAQEVFGHIELVKVLVVILNPSDYMLTSSSSFAPLFI